MAGIAEFFHRMKPGLSLGLVIRHRAVNQEEMAAKFEDLGRFRDKSFRGTEMVRGHAARHQIKRFAGIRKLFRRMQRGLDGQTAFGRRPGGFIQHRLRDVGQGHIVSQRSQEKASVSGAGGDIEGLGARLQRDRSQRLGNVIDVLQNMTAPVALALARKLVERGGLYVIEIHPQNLPQRNGFQWGSCKPGELNASMIFGRVMKMRSKTG